jgi:hypothetical protein
MSGYSSVGSTEPETRYGPRRPVKAAVFGLLAIASLSVGPIAYLNHWQWDGKNTIFTTAFCGVGCSFL